jgi:Tfp pilus assembly protein PilX
MNLTRPHPRRAQRGVVLFIALIVLVAMTLAGIAMVRSVDTTLGIAGNMAFRQSTLQTSDQGVLTAYNWLLANSTGATLQGDVPASGYYSSRPGAEPNWYDIANWNGAVVGAVDAAGNTTRYMIHRMCNCAATPYNGTCPDGINQNSCGTFTPTSGGGAGGSMQVGSLQFLGSTQVYYRITSRVDGPRNTVSIIQVTVLVQA